MRVAFNSYYTKLFGFFLMLILIVSCKQNKVETTETTIDSTTVVQETPLASWNDTKTKTAILDFVKEVTDPKSPSFVPVADRIATFDNDGTLWTEQPVYFQLFFAMDRIKELAPKHPEWKNKQPYKAVLENNMGELLKQGEKGLVEIVMASHTGVTSEEFEAIVKKWIQEKTL